MARMPPKKSKKVYEAKDDPLEPCHLKPVAADTITIKTDDCTLVVWPDNVLPGTQLHRATCHTGACVVISKPHHEAIKISEMLCRYDHPNLLKPIGIWTDPNKDGNSYLAFEEVHGCVKSMGNGLFNMEGSSIYGFSDSGFKILRGIFSAVHYVNEYYETDAESTSSDTHAESTSSDRTHRLHALKLVDSTIFYRVAANEVQAVLGDFYIKKPGPLCSLKTRNRKPRDPTREELQKFNWNSTGGFLRGLYKKDDANEEIEHLANFLNGKTVKYDDLLWEPGVWEADLKMEFIRETWWHVDRQRDSSKIMELKDTEKGKLLSQKPALGIIACIEKLLEPTHNKIVEKTLMDSVQHLRDRIVAHHDLSYLAYQGPKDDVGCTKAGIDRFVQKTKSNYMIQLVKEIRPLGWITKSPLLRDEGSYMDYFYEMKRSDNLKDKEEIEKLDKEDEEKKKMQKEERKKGKNPM